MYAELVKPWIIFSLMFLLVGGAVMRVSEQRLPDLAAQIRADAEAAAVSPEYNRNLPEAENAALLYQQAFEKLALPQDAFDGIYKNGDLVDLWAINEQAETRQFRDGVTLLLPPSSIPFPPTLRRQIEEMLTAQAEPLQLLHQGAALPDAYWKREYFEGWTGRQARKTCWADQTDLPKLLLYEMLLHVLDRNEARFREALDALALFNKRSILCTEPPRMTYNRFQSISPFALRILLGYGIESGLFSDELLAHASQALDWPPETTGTIFFETLSDAREYEPQYATQYQKEQQGIRKRLGLLRGTGFFWYRDRFHGLAAQRSMLLNQHMQRVLLDGTMEATLAEGDNDNWINLALSWGNARPYKNPFNSDTPIVFDYLYGIDYRLRRMRANAFYNARLAFVMAAEQYRRAHGAFPDTIEQLVPNYLSELQFGLIHKRGYHYMRTDTGWDFTQVQMGRINMPSSLLQDSHPMRRLGTRQEGI